MVGSSGRKPKNTCIDNGLDGQCLCVQQYHIEPSKTKYDHWLFSHRLYICLQWEWAVVSGYCIAECLLHLLLFHLLTHKPFSIFYQCALHTHKPFSVHYTLTNCLVFGSCDHKVRIACVHTLTQVSLFITFSHGRSCLLMISG